MHMFVNLLLTWLWIMHEAYPTVAQDSAPAQKQCPNRNALIFDSTFLTKVNSMLDLKFLRLQLEWRTLKPKGRVKLTKR